MALVVVVGLAAGIVGTQSPTAHATEIMKYVVIDPARHCWVDMGGTRYVCVDRHGKVVKHGKPSRGKHFEQDGIGIKEVSNYPPRHNPDPWRWLYAGISIDGRLLVLFG